MNIMRLPTLLLLLCAGRVFGVDLGLLWDPSSSPAVTNYVIYCSTNTLNVTGGTSNLAASATTIINAGTNTTVTLQNILPAHWQFAATAQAGGIESSPSNVLDVEVAQPPGKLRPLLLQYGFDLSHMTNNAVFFQLKFPN